jgi:hypothetical protein
MALLALGSPDSRALEITPSVTVGEIYTSNVNLAPDGQEESEWVTRVVPGVNLAFVGNDLQVDVDYLLEALFYADESDRNDIFNQLDAQALLNLVGEELQLRARGLITQVNVSPEAPVSSSNIPVTGNRTDAITWDIGPEWQKPVFSNSEVAGYARVGHVDFDDNPRTDDNTAGTVVQEVQDVDTIDAAMFLRSLDESIRPLRYEVAYQYERVDYDISGDATQQSAWLELGYRLGAEWEVFGLVGADSDFEDPDDTSLSEGRWETGFALASDTARFEAAIGHRYFGSTWRVDFLVEDAGVTYRVRYDESPTTTDLTDIQEIPVGPPGEELAPAPPDSGLYRPGSPVRYLYKRGDASVSREMYRTEGTVGLFWESREDLSTFNPDVSEVQQFDDEDSWGAYVDFDWEVGSRSTLGLTASWINRSYNNTLVDDPPTSDDDSIDLRARWEYELGLRTRLGFQTGWTSRDQSDGAFGDYDEYWASVELGRTF